MGLVKATSIITAFLVILDSIFAWTQVNNAQKLSKSHNLLSETEVSGKLATKVKTDYSIKPITADFDNGWIILQWTAPGDDGNVGQASSYDLRYQHSSLGPIDAEQEWQEATQVDGEPSPQPAGQTDLIVVSGLEFGASYYFCIKACDECSNCSALSNSPLITVDNNYEDFLPGDANGDDNVMGNDVTYSVRYFKGLGAPPPDSCPYDGGWLYSAGDANGNCKYTGSDVTFLVAYFKGYNPAILWCPNIPPEGGPVVLSRNRDVTPAVLPKE